MTDPDKETLDRETREAIDALVRRLRDKGEADDEPFAAEYVAFLKTLGWRPVLAVPTSADWRRRGTGSGTPDPTGEGGAEYLAWKAARGWTGPQPALTADRERELLREGPDP